MATFHDKGDLQIDFKKSLSDMIVTISDNGGGFDPLGETKGYGLKLTKDRIDLLNKTLKEQSIKFSITSSGKGTVAQLVFKNWLS